MEKPRSVVPSSSAPRAPVARSASGARPCVEEPFIQAAEVWLPQGTGLRHQSGFYGRHGSFARASFVTTFERGQGLPGTAFETARAQLCPSIQPDSPRNRRALDAGLESALALPVVREREVLAVVVFWAGRVGRSSLAIWNARGSPASCSDRCGGSGDVLRVAQSMAERSAVSGLPVFEMPAQGTTGSTSASPPGGLALPNVGRRGSDEVITLVGSAAAPWARAFELWLPNARGQLSLDHSYYGPGLSEFATASQGLNFEPGEGLPGRVYESGLPLVFVGVHARPFVRAEAAEGAGLEYGIGIPFFEGAKVSAVLTWLG
ncbi:MAG TPA: GAF domain-containing protein [Polyangiaceae bacterium]|nr:GAF domain-containing protein [Polyangiaceae bacterium]